MWHHLLWESSAARAVRRAKEIRVKYTKGALLVASSEVAGYAARPYVEEYERPFRQEFRAFASRIFDEPSVAVPWFRKDKRQGLGDFKNDANADFDAKTRIWPSLSDEKENFTQAFKDEKTSNENAKLDASPSAITRALEQRLEECQAGTDGKKGPLDESSDFQMLRCSLREYRPGANPLSLMAFAAQETYEMEKFEAEEDEDEDED